MLINICWFIYAIGVFGAIAGMLDLLTHNYTRQTMRPKAVLAIIILIPGVNHYLMWEAFKEVHAQKNAYRNAQMNYKKRMSQVNNGKGV